MGKPVRPRGEHHHRAVDRRPEASVTDAEWRLADGRIVVPEVDGGFHKDVEHYDKDLRRQRKLTTLEGVILRCGAFELRADPEAVAADLRALGVGRLSD